MLNNNTPLRVSHPCQAWVINVLLLVTFVILGFAIFLPMLTLKYFVLGFFVLKQKTISLYSTLTTLQEAGEIILFLVIFLFSIIFPILKLVILALATNITVAPKSVLARLFHWIEQFGKWSMLEVFVVALLLVSVKLGALLAVQVHHGVYLFALAVVITMLLSYWIERLLQINHRQYGFYSASHNI